MSIGTLIENKKSDHTSAREPSSASFLHMTIFKLVPQLVFNCSCKYSKNVSYLADLVCVKVLLVRLRVVVENICKLLNIGLIIVGYLTLVCLLFVKQQNASLSK